MIASILVDNSVDARRHHKSNHQSISQSCYQSQHSSVLTAGANSPVLNSGNNALYALTQTMAVTQQPSKKVCYDSNNK